MKFTLASWLIRLQIKSDRKQKVLEKIRKFAVTCLEKASEPMDFMLLQLTASLKYEQYKKKKSVLFQFLTQRLKNSPKWAANFYWSLAVESENPMPIVRGWYKKILTAFIEELNKNKTEVALYLNNSIMFRDFLQASYKKCIADQKSLADKQVIWTGTNPRAHEQRH